MARNQIFMVFSAILVPSFSALPISCFLSAVPISSYYGLKSVVSDWSSQLIIMLPLGTRVPHIFAVYVSCCHGNMYSVFSMYQTSVV